VALAQAIAPVSVASGRSDRLAVSVVVEAGCGLTLPRLLAEARGARAGACAPSRTTPLPPQPVVTLRREAGGDVLLVEF
jgi:hypothetical protein